MHVLAPYNDIVGFSASQVSATTPNTIDPISFSYLTDTQVTNLLSGVATANTSARVRCLSFCVEVLTTGAVMNVQNEVMSLKYPQGGVPVLGVSGGSGPTTQGFFDTWLGVAANDDTVRNSFSSLVAGKCTHVPMVDPDALQYHPTPVGSSAWLVQYGAQPATSSITATGAGCAYSPLVLVFPPGLNIPSYDVIVTAELEVVPPAGSWAERIAYEIPPSINSQQAWWVHQAKLRREGWTTSNALPGASVGPLLGRTQPKRQPRGRRSKKRAPKALPVAPPPPPLTRTTTTLPPRPARRPSAVGAAASAVAGLLGAAMMGPARRARLRGAIGRDGRELRGLSRRW